MRLDSYSLATLMSTQAADCLRSTCKSPHDPQPSNRNPLVRPVLSISGVCRKFLEVSHVLSVHRECYYFLTSCMTTQRLEPPQQQLLVPRTATVNPTLPTLLGSAACDTERGQTQPSTPIRSSPDRTTTGSPLYFPTNTVNRLARKASQDSTTSLA